jgi:2-polyprenyl-3-methyl-5-hydroxy-6-metoxy-1,4-benzoquinol methylase
MKLQAEAEGHYYRKQLGCKSWLISWSHGARFRMALKLIGDCKGKKLLDYGCGDGTFLAFASERIKEGCGADIADDQLAGCKSRLADFSNLRFCTVNALNDPGHNAAYDIVTCMETLEHCVDPIVDVVLGDLLRLCKPGGHVVISVPIETGPTFLGKYVARKIAGMRGLSDYRHYERYTAKNALRMLFATKQTQLQRPVYGEDGAPYHSHYGFNWRRLRERVRQRFLIEKTLYSPLGFLCGYFSSQAWFVCRPLP